MEKHLIRGMEKALTSFKNVLHLGVFFLIVFFASMPLSFGNALKETQKIAADSLRMNETLKRVASENMANAESSGYKPKSVLVKPKRDAQSKVDSVEIKKIRPNKKKTIQRYEPNHPKADEKGYVEMPNINPLIEMVNIQNSKHASERALRVYEMATDLRHKTIALMK